MKGFVDLKTGTKLLLAFGLIILFLIVVIVTAYSGISEMRRDYQTALILAELEANNNGQRAAVLTMLAETSATNREAIHQQIRALRADNDDLYERLPGLIPNDPVMIRQMRELTTIRSAHAQARDEEVIPLIEEGRIEEARHISLGVNEQRYAQMRDLGKALSDAVQAQANQEARQALITFTIIGLLAVLGAMVLAWFISRIIATPLKELSETAERIATGDLRSNHLVINRGDEVGVLAQAFARMTSSLQNMADVARSIAAGDLRVQVRPQSEHDVLGNAFAAMVQNLRRLTADLTEGISVLGSAASEISTSTTQFAAGAAETAAAVNETTTTVEEVRQTAQVSSQKARTVSETAQKVSQISQSGKKATEETVEGMRRIQEQMDAIAQSMVHLSEQSQAIGQIVTTVEGLAVQSNLLAVNASIEAAKAGEHGRGFAVVAQEVKSLAEQSRQATGQVRTILSEIQKATTAAMMATEQGSKAVEAGVKQSSQAGQSIQTLAGGVAEAAQAAAQIAASSQQQLVGVDQVATAMENIKQASTQNVDSARQLEAAAHDLKELGQKLKQLVERYQV